MNSDFRPWLPLKIVIPKGLETYSPSTLDPYIEKIIEANFPEQYWDSLTIVHKSDRDIILYFPDVEDTRVIRWEFDDSSALPEVIDLFFPKEGKLSSHQSINGRLALNTLRAQIDLLDLETSS